MKAQFVWRNAKKRTNSTNSSYHGWTDRKGWHIFYHPATKTGEPLFLDGPIWEFASPAYIETLELLNWETA